MNHFLLVGAGGTATYLMPGLTRYLKSTYGDDWLLAIVDGDAVEAGNLERQAHEAKAIGVNKAEALHAAYPENTIAVPHYLSDKNIEQLIQEETTVIITVDNFPCRVRIENHVSKLENARVLNAGNEMDTGSVQIWLRAENKNETPPLTFLHPEITMDGPDRADMTCQQVAKLPGGGQTAIANNMAAGFILQSLNMLQANPKKIPWHEVHFDNAKGLVEMIDYRETKTWQNFSQSSEPSEQ